MADKFHFVNRLLDRHRPCFVELLTNDDGRVTELRFDSFARGGGNNVFLGRLGVLLFTVGHEFVDGEFGRREVTRWGLTTAVLRLLLLAAEPFIKLLGGQIKCRQPICGNCLGPDDWAFIADCYFNTLSRLCLRWIGLVCNFHFYALRTRSILLDFFQLFYDMGPEAVTDLSIMTLNNDFHDNLLG